MNRLNLITSLFAGLVVCLTLATVAPAGTPHDPVKYQGTLSDGATYLIEVPPEWNGTLFLYSHGTQVGRNPAKVSQDHFTREWLLERGYALAGGSYPTTGYDPVTFGPSQIRVLDEFEALVGAPARTIAWGHSLGGTITAQLVQAFPERFAGALPICGAVAGSVGRYNARLDHAFVMKTLLGFDRPIVNVGFGHGQVLAFVNRMLEVAAAAQQTAGGRARLALAEAMVGTPDWSSDPLDPHPAQNDFPARQLYQYLWFQISGVFQDAARAPYERRIGTWNEPGDGSVSGGNFSWNVDVDYREQLNRSGFRDLVEGLYAQAGLDLEADLDRLASAPRIAADSGAVDKLVDLDPIFTGDLGDMPVLTTHTLGDGFIIPNQEDAYARAVAGAGNSHLLRQLTVARAGHCEFTGAEQVAAIQTLLARIDGGSWPSTSAPDINARAAALGANLNKFVGVSTTLGKPEPPKFVDTGFSSFPRFFDPASLIP